MKSSEYWEKRIANGTWTTYNNLEEKNRALLEMYQEASLNISDELYRVSEKMKTSTPTLSDMHKFDRLTKLQKNIENIIGELGENVEKFYISNATQGFKEVYKNVRVALGETDFSEPPKKLMEQLLRKQWEGSNFSTRLWKNTQVLVTNLNDVVSNGLIQGKTITEMAIQLNNRMNKEFNISHRLVRSETMHYLNESAKKAYMDSEVKRVQFWAAVDERACLRCGAKHGNPYNLKDAPVLPLHANCRCTYIPIIDDDVAKNSHDIAKEDVKKEWQRRSIPDEQIKDKMKKNYETDMKQYKKYKEVLGEELPKSFDKFQGLKYNNSESWDFVKLDYQRRKQLIDDPNLVLPNADKVFIANEKFTGYLYNEANKKGYAKGKLFEDRLGYNVTNYEMLKNDIIKRATKYPAIIKLTDEHGTRYEQKIIIYGLNNKPANVIVAWNVKDDVTKMTSTYIKEVK